MKIAKFNEIKSQRWQAKTLPIRNAHSDKLLLNHVNSNVSHSILMFRLMLYPALFRYRQKVNPCTYQKSLHPHPNYGFLGFNYQPCIKNSLALNTYFTHFWNNTFGLIVYIGGIKESLRVMDAARSANWRSAKGLRGRLRIGVFPLDKGLTFPAGCLLLWFLT